MRLGGSSAQLGRKYDTPRNFDTESTERLSALQHLQAVTVMGVIEVYEDADRSVRGYIEFRDEDEFDWLKRRIEGGRRVG